MAWEERKGRLYYYAKQRIGDRVVSRYVGTGPAAHQAAAAKEDQRTNRQADAEDRRQWQELEATLDTLKQQIDRQLREAGLHRPNWSRWRKRRSPA